MTYTVRDSQPPPSRAAADKPRRTSVTRQQPMDMAFFRALDFLVLAVVCISYAAIGLLAADAFDARLAVVAGLLLATAGRYFLPARFEPGRASSGRPVFPVILLVLLTALLFRADPFRPMHGGQDQGVYVSMSSHLQREGSVFVDDRVPEALPDERTREIYAAGMPENPAWNSGVQPGVYHSHSEGDYVFQFYHLHPLWMATFAELLGDGARFYALTFFSLLSIVGLCLLVLEMTGARMAALAMGLLLAVNPLHVFFSRLHVTEIVALAFSALGFYYLARAARGVQDSAPPASTASLAALSALSLSLVFFVRITGFLYLPLVALVYALGVWWTTRQRPAYTRQVVGYGALVAALYGVSVLYGLEYSPIYSREIYVWRFAGLLGTYWQEILALGALAVLAAGAALPLAVRRERVRGWLAPAARPGPWVGLASLAAAAAAAACLYQAYVLGFTDRLAGVEYHARFGIVGIGAPIFWQTAVVGWLLYTSPPLALLAVAGAHRSRRQWPVVLLYVFLGSCLFATLAINVPVIYQHYYYARYLVSEVVPYALAIAVAATFLSTSRRFRLAGAAAIALSVPFHTHFVLQQYPVREGARPYAVMRSIAETVGDGVLLLDLDAWGGKLQARSARLQTPLTYYFGKRVFPYESPDLGTILSSFEGAIGAGVWLLSNRPSTHPSLQLHRTYDYWDVRMDSAPTIPTNRHDNYWQQMLYLYRQPDVCETPGCDLRFRDGRLYPTRRGYIYAETVLGAGWHNPEPGHVWSSEAQTLELSRGWFAEGRWPAAVVLEMQPFGASPEHPVTLVALSGGREEALVFDSSEVAVHEIGLDCPRESRACTVLLNVHGARSPSAVSGSPDGRTLGIALYNIGFRSGREAH